MKLKDLAVEHQYYCSDSNYYSSDAGKTWDSMTDFLDEFEDADEDLNLVFRWDIYKKSDENDEEIDGYRAEVFIIHQRKGIFSPHVINDFQEFEVNRFVAYLKKHKEVLLKNWIPL